MCSKPLSRPLLPMAFCLLLGACHHAAPEPAAGDEPTIDGETVTLSAAAAKAGGIATAPATPAPAASLSLPGRLVWDEDHTVRVSSPFSGRVTAIEAQPGATVSAGQTLAWLSSADYGTAQAEAHKANAALALAAKAAARSRDLLEHGVIAEKDAEQATADLAAAQAEAQRAEARLKLFGDRAAGVDQRYRLASPIAGTVVEKTLNPGQEVSADAGGAPLFVITDPTQLWVQLDEPEAALAAITPGLTLDLESPVYPGEHFQAELAQVSDFVDPVTRTLKLRGRVANPQRRLKAEMYVTARLNLPQPANPPLSVPASAVFLSGERELVFVAGPDHHYTRRSVKIGPPRDGNVTVLEGLKPDEQVVIAGNLFLQQLMQNQQQDGRS